MRLFPLIRLELVSIIIGLLFFGPTLEALGVASSLSLMILIALMALKELDGHFSVLDSWFVDPADALYFGLFPAPRWFQFIAGVAVAFAFESAVGIHGMPVLSKVGIVCSTFMLFVDVGIMRAHVKMKVR